MSREAVSFQCECIELPFCSFRLLEYDNCALCSGVEALFQSARNGSFPARQAVVLYTSVEKRETITLYRFKENGSQWGLAGGFWRSIKVKKIAPSILASTHSCPLGLQPAPSSLSLPVREWGAPHFRALRCRQFELYVTIIIQYDRYTVQ